MSQHHRRVICLFLNWQNCVEDQYAAILDFTIFASRKEKIKNKPLQNCTFIKNNNGISNFTMNSDLLKTKEKYWTFFLNVQPKQKATSEKSEISRQSQFSSPCKQCFRSSAGKYVIVYHQYYPYLENGLARRKNRKIVIFGLFFLE